MFASTQDFIMISVIKKHYAGKSLLSRDLITREENHEVLFFFPVVQKNPIDTGLFTEKYETHRRLWRSAEY